MTLSANRPSAALALSAATLIATVVGGILGVTVGRSEWFPTVPLLLGGLGLIALAGMVLVDAGTAEQPAHPEHGGDGGGQPVAQPTLTGPAEAGPPGETAQHRTAEPQAAEHQTQVPSGEQVHMVLPVPSVKWWDQENPSAHAVTAAPAATQVPPPELETYLQTSIVAQCPRCGAFHLDAAAAPPGYRFRCRACAFDWGWQPGEPWPAVQVNPRRRQPATDSAAQP